MRVLLEIPASSATCRVSETNAVQVRSEPRSTEFSGSCRTADAARQMFATAAIRSRRIGMPPSFSAASSSRGRHPHR
ncbi:hypothetical protein ASD08_06460 [Streptomyces sp. Root369]|nr:hypothetical protein ASD08_06460 [Streptomyces sp. Root369]